jgi:hypothetical protein
VSLILPVGLALLIALGWFRPLIGDRWFRAIEKYTFDFARKKSSVVVGVGVLAVLSRLAILPLQPVPLPVIHDEFSNLLAADTFAHGRLSNPPHPMWIFFDTFHVLQHPTYVSKYPPGEGLVLALGQLLGTPWLGTLLTLGLMSMAMTWMLQGWLPPHWAMLGGIFVVWRLCLFNIWFDGYLGGAVAGLGAALVLGAYPRVIAFSRARYAAWMGVGIVILALSRPMEGLVFCVPVALWLAFLAYRRIRNGAYRVVLRTLVFPCGGVVSAGIVWLGYYNWRTSGNPFVFAYSLYHRAYFAYPLFAWQKMPPPLHYSNPQFEAFFNRWNRTIYRLNPELWRIRAGLAIEMWYQTYLGRILSIPLLAFARTCRDRRMRLPLTEMLLCGIGLLSVVWFQPHYATPMAAALYLLVMQSMRHLRRFSCRGRLFGVYLSRLVVILAVCWTFALIWHWARNPWTPWSKQRVQIVDRLQSLPGKQLVIVTYASNHNPHQEWVYNGADIDSAKIVWARAIPGLDLNPLLTYFANRKAWVLYPDETPPRLTGYPLRNPAEGPQTAPAGQPPEEPR